MTMAKFLDKKLGFSFLSLVAKPGKYSGVSTCLKPLASNQGFGKQFYGTKRLTDELNLPNPPKRPMSPHVKYALNKRESNQSKGFIEYVKAYSNLPEHEKAKYIEQYKSEFTQYKIKLEEYGSKLSEDDKIKIQKLGLEKKLEKLKKMADKRKQQDLELLNKPKRPVPGMILFFQEKKQEDGAFKNLQDCQEQWRNLAPSEKEVYNNRSKENRIAFEKELAAWELKMFQEGRTDLLRKSTLLKLEKEKDDSD